MFKEFCMQFLCFLPDLSCLNCNFYDKLCHFIFLFLFFPTEWSCPIKDIWCGLLELQDQVLRTLRELQFNLLFIAVVDKNRMLNQMFDVPTELQ